MRGSRVIPVALILIIVAIAIAALISLARTVFFPNASTTLPTDTSTSSLLNTSVGHSVVMTVRGPIVGSEDARSYEVIVTPNSRALITYSGYQNQPIDQIDLGNNSDAYAQFVYALDKADLVKGTELTGDANDLRGVCATGRLYTFAVLSGGNSVKTLWTSTCSSAKGSLNANVESLILLFIDQVPNSRTTIGKIDL